MPNYQSISKAWLPVTVSIVIGISFMFHSSLFTPILSSDYAIISLMIKYLHFPDDLYYWGSDRYGTFIPLVGQFFYKVLNFDILTSESITHYLLLIAGYVGFASLFKHKISKLLFAIVWFFPPYRMLGLMYLSQGQQYALVGIGVFFLNYLYNENAETSNIKKHIMLLVVALSFISAVWVSDLGIVSIAIVLFFYMLRYWQQHRKQTIKRGIVSVEFYYLLIGFIVGASFIVYAKSHAVKNANYYDFFEPEVFWGSLKMFAGTIYDLLLFEANDPFTSIYFYLVIIGSIALIINLKNVILTKTQRFWLRVFLLDVVAVFLVIIASR